MNTTTLDGGGVKMGCSSLSSVSVIIILAVFFAMVVKLPVSPRRLFCIFYFIPRPPPPPPPYPPYTDINHRTTERPTDGKAPF